jgi:hypothetical protein
MGRRELCRVPTGRTTEYGVIMPGVALCRDFVYVGEYGNGKNERELDRMLLREESLGGVLRRLFDEP